MRSDDEVIDRGGAREARAVGQTFDEFFLANHDDLYRALFFITGSSHDADELCQDAFLKLWERWDRMGTVDDPVGYLFRVALNGFRLRLRRAKTAARRILPADDLPRDPFDEIDVREDLHVLLRSLPTRQRAALVLTEIFDYSSEHAGQIMRIKAGTVRVLAFQGREKLRQNTKGST